ncbi:unnamed protein product [Caenorhabditis angaria]|uniref:Calcineurin-like phosphoesterase domain-containing protein n=1 Tax=Caenorhabditis angaria TaxID=860376 RepID=A0A9P1IM42_9PELO|nr:unnamed protein product [Caenorhabditis angaria]
MRKKCQIVYGVPLTCLFFVVLWNERLAFWWLARNWEIHEENHEDCDRILLVADPQLIGYQNEQWGSLARWDSDRYLATGFAYAKSYFHPNSLIFLGDLFDEGVEADEDEWSETYERFLSIFPVEKNQNVIYIAGDNDIGGEMEPISAARRDKFAHYFRNNITYLQRFYSFSETFLFDHLAGNAEKSLSRSKNAKKLDILLTHVPYLEQFYKFNNVGANKDLILSAHDHTVGIYEIQRSGPKAVLFTTISDASPIYRKTIGPGEPIIELKTPTCSYRMGVASMGYGALSICRSSQDPYRSIEVQFSILWLPARFAQFFLYIFTLLFCCAWIFVQKRSRAKKYAWLQ